MTRQDILSLFENCTLTYLTEINYEPRVIDHLPEDFPFTYDNGVTRLAILPSDAPFVIKLPFAPADYCLKELLLYREAKQQKINHLFLKPALVGSIDDTPIYIEPRAETYASTYDSDQSYSTSTSCEYFPPDWIDAVAYYYRPSLIKRFLAFVSSHKLYSDMHERNFGWYNDRPVLIDYAGFGENESG